jgi:ferredoxin
MAEDIQLTTSLVVDPIACGGIGVCAHLAPGLVVLDRWGYPVMPDGPLSPDETRRAQRAVTGCPRQALTLRG